MLQMLQNKNPAEGGAFVLITDSYFFSGCWPFFVVIEKKAKTKFTPSKTQR